MRIGLHLPQIGDWAGPEALRRAAVHVEETGLDSVWVSDHLAFPEGEASAYPYSKDGSFPVSFDSPWLEALTSMAFIAAVTSRVSIGVSVLVAPLRNTLLLGKQIATLAALAPGRIVLGAGAGWLREEFELLDADFGARGRILDEQLGALRELWTSPRPSFSGEHVSFPPLIMKPHPEPPPQLWVGGTAPAALRRAGRHGDAWHAVGGLDEEQLRAALSTVRESAAAAGRPAESVALTVRIGTRPGVKGLESLRRRLAPFAAVGCEHAVVDPVVDSLEELLDLVEELAALPERSA